MKLQIPDADVLWDTLPHARKHELEVVVGPDDLDDLHHVNNTVYLAWCEAVARAHALLAVADQQVGGAGQGCHALVHGLRHAFVQGPRCHQRGHAQGIYTIVCALTRRGG